jgi:hypothetical protein
MIKLTFLHLVFLQQVNVQLYGENVPTKHSLVMVVLQVLTISGQKDVSLFAIFPHLTFHSLFQQFRNR